MKMKLRQVVFAGVFFGLLFIYPIDVEAKKPINDEEMIEESLLEELELSNLNEHWQQINEQYGQFIPELANKSLLEFIKNNDKLTLKSMLLASIHYFFYEIIVNGKLIGTLLILTVFSAILQMSHAQFEKNSVSKVAYFIVYLTLIYLVLTSFNIVFTYAHQTIHTMTNLMIALLPLLLALIASFGQIISVAFFHPIIIFLIHLTNLLISSVIYPLLYVAAILILISQLNENFKLTHLAQLITTVCLTLLGLLFSVFLGILTIQGTTTAIEDGIAMKTTKFVTNNFIPVIGRSITDATDTVLAAGLLLKNSIGVVGLLIIVVITLFPAIKIAVIALIYKLVASFLQPLGENIITDSLHAVSKYIIYLLISLLLVSFMFFLIIVIIVMTSNLPFIFK